MDLGLQGKRALVTGSSSGIGVGIAEMLAAEGCSVVVHGRNEARARAVAERIAATGAKSALAIGDLAIAEEAATVAAAASEAFGGIDILVNNAGGSSDNPDKSWFGTTPEDFLATYQANLLAAVRLIHALVPAMRERGWGRIINISTAAAITPTSGQADYGPAKAAMLNMSLGASRALKNSGVTSNSVSPGMIRTDGIDMYLATMAKQRGWGDDVKKAEEMLLKGINQSVARVGEVDDIAYAVTMLASPRSDFINGTNVHVDGGISPSLN
ncbi:MAG: SDR family oxidoreductase [Sphingomonadales bacterium]|nr:SDR family oxidoreductase [Sphingomonadales bacterium]MBU3991867.1 SDR family oxidoreductase [Alphaproteobacteria bacterium]